MAAHVESIGRVEREGRDIQRLWEQRFRRFGEGRAAYLLTAPLIYSVLVPVALLDGWMTLYQAVCFRVYGIPRVTRAEYIVLDRHRLPYLGAIEKINCVYCGYVNGVFAYVGEIAARTEEYWCPIKHARPVRAPHARYRRFAAYGDAEAYRRREMRLRTGRPGQRR